jgi:hypothetical protein
VPVTDSLILVAVDLEDWGSGVVLVDAGILCGKGLRVWKGKWTVKAFTVLYCNMTGEGGRGDIRIFSPSLVWVSLRKASDILAVGWLLLGLGGWYVGWL